MIIASEEFCKVLNGNTTIMAEQLKLIRTRMTGKGISPREASLIEFNLQEIENKLRMLGADPKNVIPFA